MTPKNLLKNSREQAQKYHSFIALEGYPLLVIITTDKQNHGHPLAYALVNRKMKKAIITFYMNLKSSLT